MKNTTSICPECTGDDQVWRPTRRDVLLAAGGLALAGWTPVWAGTETRPKAETFAQELFQTLSTDHRKILCFPYANPKRNRVSANWAITNLKIDELETKQKDLVERILKGLTSEEGYEKFQTQMADDDGGLGSYHLAFFGQPGDKQFELVMTGRHMTLRADGNFNEGAAFAGPMVYGHQGASEPEKAGHPSNVFWYQAKRANEVFRAMDGKQREKCLLTRAPREDQIRFRKEGYPGLCVGEMSADQQHLVEAVLRDLLSPYRKEDADEAMAVLVHNGGLKKLHVAFYKQADDGSNVDLGDDGVWDVWRLEGPGFVWHFRGAPHVHVWVNIARV